MTGRRTLGVALLAGLILTACATPRPVDSLRASGDRYYKIGDYVAAAEEYRQITERYPGDWRAQYMLGRALLESGRPFEAREALEVAITRRPDDPGVIDALAEAMYRGGDAEALFTFLRQRAHETGAPVDYLRLARYSLELDDPDSAQRWIQTAIDLDDGRTVEPYLSAADLAERLGDDAEVRRRLRQAYGIDPRDPRVLDRIRIAGEVPGPTLALPAGP